MSAKLTVRNAMVTPSIATEMMARNTSNRRLRSTWIRELARRMVDGDWKMNGETIAFSASGRLMNGQHRLMAVIESGVDIPFIIVEGVPDDCFDTIDNGSRRRASDSLYISGFRHPKELASAASLVWRYERGLLADDATILPSHAEVLQTVNDHPSLMEITSKCMGCNIKALGGGAAVVFVCYGAYRTMGELQFTRWFSSLVGDIPTGNHDPVGMFIRRLQDNRVSKSKLRSRDLVAIGIKAAEAFHLGRSIKCLKWAHVEQYPFFRSWAPWMENKNGEVHIAVAK